MPLPPSRVIVQMEPTDPEAGRVGAGAVRVAVATALFGVSHSFFAGTWAKSGAAVLLGVRTANGLYRPAYIAVTCLLVGLLIWYTRKQPGRELYRARGAVAWMLRAGQVLALA